MIVGSGKFRYRGNADWAKLPAGWSFKEIGGVGVDTNDNVSVFNRGGHPMNSHLLPTFNCVVVVAP
jgi:hypothetical protein